MKRTVSEVNYLTLSTTFECLMFARLMVNSSAPVISQPRLSDLFHVHSLRSVSGGNTIQESEGTLRAKRVREIQRPPLAD